MKRDPAGWCRKGIFHGRGTVQSSFVHHLHHARLPAPPFVHPEGGDVPRAFRHRVLHHSAVHHHNQHQRRARDFRNALARRSGRALQRPHGRHRLRDDLRQGPAGTRLFHAQPFGLQHRHVRHAFRRRVPASHRVPGHLPVRRRERDHVHGRYLRARQQRYRRLTASVHQEFPAQRLFVHPFLHLSDHDTWRSCTSPCRIP